MVAVGAEARFDIGRVISRTFGVVGSNFLPFMVLALIFEGAPELVVSLVQLGLHLQTGGLQGTAVYLVIVMLKVVLGCVLATALAEGALRDLDRRKVSLADCLAAGLRYALPALVIGIATAVAGVLGLMLFIVPGVLILLAWSVATPVLVVEGVGPFTSLARSRALTQGNRWALLGLFVIFFLILVGIAIPVGLLSAVLTFALPGSFLPAVIINALLSAFGAMLDGVLVAAAYVELRGAREGLGVKDLAAVFD